MKFLIDRNITISMVFIALTFLGYVSYKQLQMELMPSTELPKMSVSVNSTVDYDPVYVETQVIIPLEGVVAKVSGIEKMTSNVNTKGGSITVEFKAGTNMKTTSIEFTKEVNEAARDLPDGFTLTTSRASYDTGNTQFMLLSLKGEGEVDQIRAIAETELISRLENIDGIIGVNLYGGRERSIQVELNNSLAQPLGVNSATVIEKIAGAGSERNFVGYTSNVGGSNSGVFVEGGYNDIDLIGAVVIADGPVYLRDIADITYQLKEPTSISRVDGERAISVSLSSESGVNVIELAERTESEIEALNEYFAPQNVSVIKENSVADEIERNITQIGKMGILGAMLAAVVLWFFLHNVALALSISLAIPISIFAAFNLFYMFGVTINSLTLIGMTLAIGMLLDNSIVVLENIYRLFRDGESAADAVIKGTRQVWRSIIASTLTTVTVFIPFIFTDNIFISLMGKNIGVSIISTLFFSLLVALLLIPMVTYLILRGSRVSDSVFSKKESIHERTIQIYIVVLKSVLRRPAVVLTTITFLLLVTFIWISSRTEQSGKSVSSDQITVTLDMPDGSTVASNDKNIIIVEQRLDSIAECQQIRSMVGEESATVTLKLKDKFEKIASRDIGQIVDDVWRRLANLEGVDNVDVSTGSSSSSGGGMMSADFLSMMGIGGSENVLLLKGSDYEQMLAIAEDLKTRIDELDFIANVNVSSQRGSRRVEIDVDPIVATSLGIGRSELSQTLSSLTDEISSGAEIKMGEDLIDIVVTSSTIEKDTIESAFNELKDLSELKNSQILTSSGASYSLEHVATIRKDRGKGRIQRVDRSRELKIEYRFSQNDLTEDIIDGYNLEVDGVVADYPMPSGIAIEREEKEDIMDDFTYLIVASVILIFIILASVFESISTPFILLFAIPLAAIGSFVALILSGNIIDGNINVMTGFLILIGVVVNGGIILIDYANSLRKSGFCRNRALLMSGASRLNPIMITTITTIIAMLPLALEDNEYAGAIGAPFAITVIGGLSFSSLLTLIIVPTLYISMEGIIKWYRSLHKSIYFIHALIMTIVVVYLLNKFDSMLIQSAYIAFSVALIPGITYLILNSVRIANSNIIGKDEPIVIEVRNLVKIYDRPSRFVREWQGAKNLRERLGLDGECNKLSDIKDLIWKGVLSLSLYLGGLLYFEKGMWITIVFVLWVVLSISMWRRFYKYHLNSRGGVPNRAMKFKNRFFVWIVTFVAIASYVISSGSIGGGVAYVVILLIFYLFYILARRAERLNINVERINGRFSSIRRTFYSIALSLPFIGRRKKSFTALKGVSFNINNGMFGLLGSNGAGKSTFMRILTGIYEQSYGTIWINGKDTRKYREELQSLIGFLPQEFGMYEEMSAWSFLDYQAILKGLTGNELRRERIDYVLNAVHMYDRKDAKIGSFSGGMKQRIGIAMILLNLPRILVVDEPTAGLDPRERIRFRNLLVELSKDRVVVFSTHIIEDIASSCNQVAVITRGDLIYSGEPNDMLSFAKDKVWSFTCSQQEFETIDHTLIANHMRDSSGNIRVRYVSSVKPIDSAVRETELLEDAYLCLLKGI